MARCTATRRDGQPCSAIAMKEGGVCIFHAPAEEREGLKRKKDEEFDIEAALKRELRRLQKAKGDPLERARLANEIVKTLNQLKQGPKPQEEPASVMDKIRSYRGQD